MIRNDKDNVAILNQYELTDELIEGAIGLVYNKFHWFRLLTWLSKIIRRVRNSPINHCFTLFRKDGRWYVSEAIETGITSSLLSDKIVKWKKRGDIVLIKYPPKVDKPALHHFIEKYKDFRYGFETLLKFFWATLLRQPLKSKASRLLKHFVCSQWCALLDGRYNAYRFSPKEIFDLPYKTKKLDLDIKIVNI